MPTFTTIIEDTSPVLSYNGAWVAGTSGDKLASQYSQASFMVTAQAGASMSFSFFGSSISIIGAKRLNHGDYHVQLDDQTFAQTSGSVKGDFMNQTLFNSEVELGNHKVTIFNDGTNFLDIDYISYDTLVGQSSEPLIVNTYQDAHPSFEYQSSSSWTSPPLLGTFLGSTGHIRSQHDQRYLRHSDFQFPGWAQNADLVYDTIFSQYYPGNAIGLYGPVGPNNTQAYSVRVDDGPTSIFSAQKAFYRPQQLLFYAGNLSAGAHKVLVQTESNTGFLSIDYANVYSTRSLGGSFGSNSAFEIIAPSQTSPGLLAALAITTTLALFSIVALIWLFLRRPREPKFIDLAEEKQDWSNENLVIPYAVPQAILQGASEPAMSRSLSQGSSSTVASTPLPAEGYSAPIGSDLVQTPSSSSAPRPPSQIYDARSGSSKQRLEHLYEFRDRQGLPRSPSSGRSASRLQLASSSASVRTSRASASVAEALPPPEYSQSPSPGI